MIGEKSKKKKKNTKKHAFVCNNSKSCERSDCQTSPTYQGGVPILAEFKAKHGECKTSARSLKEKNRGNPNN